MRRGESNSTFDEKQHYSGGPRNMASVQGKTPDILMTGETTEQQLQPSNMEVISVEKSRAELDYVAPPVSASHMEENLSNMELQVSAVKTQGVMSTETTDGAEETTGHGDYIEPAAVSASQMEENDDIMVGPGIISAETTDGGEETTGHGAYVEPAAISASAMEENDDIRVGHGIMSAETTDVAEETAGHGAYVEPATDSASQMEENDDIRVGHGIMSAETTDGAEETTGHGAYMEPAAVSASQMEEYYDITVGVGVDDQLVFYDGNGREFNASDHDRIGDISSTTTAAHVTYVEPAAVSSSHMKENEFPTAGAIGDYHLDWNVDGDFVNTNNYFGWDAVGLSNNDIVLGYDIWDYRSLNIGFTQQ